MHGKESAVAPVMRERLGLTVLATDQVDTDRLGTFCGDVERPGNMLQTARRKARLGMASSGLPIGLASEGAYGPHPLAPMLAAGTELMIFIDDESSLEVIETLPVGATNYATRVVSATDIDIADFLDAAGFPRHAVAVTCRAGGSRRPIVIAKGLRNAGALDDAVRDALAFSDDGQALLKSDMRAHVNPTRMAAIGQLAERLALRVGCHCPACDSPGFGKTGSDPGLPCAGCRQPTRLPSADVESCARCSFARQRPRADGLELADPQFCDYCNP